MSKKLCIIEDCGKPMIAKGWCQMHYRRVAKYGDPHSVQRVQRSPNDSSKIILLGDHALVELTQGKVALVDLDDVEKVQQYNWNYSSSTGYAYSGKVGTSMQQHLLGRAPEGMEISHEDRNKLNNRRSNLRFVTFSENHYNTEQSDNSGISFHKPSGKYQAYGIVDRKQKYLGLFPTEALAKERVTAWKIMRRRGKDEEAKAEE